MAHYYLLYTYYSNFREEKRLDLKLTSAKQIKITEESSPQKVMYSFQEAGRHKDVEDCKAL